MCRISSQCSVCSYRSYCLIIFLVCRPLCALHTMFRFFIYFVLFDLFLVCRPFVFSQDHIHDTNAYVRSKALQTWLHLCSEKVRVDLSP